MKTEVCLFYRSWFEALEGFSKSEREEAVYALIHYAFTGEVPENLFPVAKVILTMAQPIIDTNAKKKEGGRKGGRPKKKPMVAENKNHRFSELETIGSENKKPANNKNKNKNKNINENNNNPLLYFPPSGENPKPQDSEKDNPQKRFVKPTVEEVASYCRERGNAVSAERFVDYYESNGWRVGRTAMKDWKAAVRTWERTEVGHGRSSPAKPNPRFQVGNFENEESTI